MTSPAEPLPGAPPLHTIAFALRENHIVLSVAVNGHDGNLILDTGSSAGTLDRDWALGIGITAKEKPVQALGVASATASLAQVSIRFGTVELSDETVALIPLGNVSASHEVPIHGTLGYSFFARFAVEVDYPRRVLRLWPAPEYDYDRAGAIIPVDLKYRIPVANARLVPEDGEPFAARLVFDLGTSKYGAILNQRIVAEHHATLEQSMSEVQSLGAGFGGTASGRLTRLDRIEVGGYSIPAPVVALSETSDGFFGVTWAEGTIGAPSYIDSNVVVDYSRARIIIEPSRDGAADVMAQS
jgi:hypothetical protein